MPLAEEMVRVLVHGTLHALGYQHPEDHRRTRSRMWRRQERYGRALLAPPRGGGPRPPPRPRGGGGRGGGGPAPSRAGPAPRKAPRGAGGGARPPPGGRGGGPFWASALEPG